MRLRDIKENASCGATSSGAIATAISGGTPPAGQFFGGNPSSSIYGPIKKRRAARRRKQMSEAETKQAKTPEKPSGKSEISGSTKPYREPKVLGPTDKVKSVGKILGGKPKKNPTLSTKSFGTCSANNDPGNKSILGEKTVDEVQLANDIDLLRKKLVSPFLRPDEKEGVKELLNHLYGIARENGYPDKWEKGIEKQLKGKPTPHSFLNTIDDLKGRVSHRKSPNAADKAWAKSGNVTFDDPTKNWTDQDWMKAMKISPDEDTRVSEGRELPFHEPISFSGHSMKEHLMGEMWKLLSGIKPSKITGDQIVNAARDIAIRDFAKRIRTEMIEYLNYWFLHDPNGLALKDKPKHRVQESLSYKEFRNARNAVDKTCPSCSTTFKNVHSPSQIFCSSACETKGGKAHDLHELFSRRIDSQAYREGRRNGALDFQLGHRSEMSWASQYEVGASNEFRREYGQGYRDGWMEARMDADEKNPTDNSLSAYFQGKPESVIRDQM